MEKYLIEYFKSLGINVQTSTKARGHQGFYLNNRIDISKNIPKERIVPTLLHEFAHYVHSKIEPQIAKSGGNLEVIFKDNNPIIKEELVKITNFVDKNSLCERLYAHKKITQEKIKYYDKLIKKDYPKFQRSKKFKEFERYIKKSNAKYLLKYDRVKIVTGLFKRQTKVYSINTIEQDFCDMPQAFANYLRLNSYRKKQTRITNRINKCKKYYERPTELFARLVEGLYIDEEYTRSIAPYTTEIFYKLLNDGYYKELKNTLQYIETQTTF
ncbi:hypothetical protein J6E39_05690 [bacterium]|nr:hypothetical protein [bacterium]